MEAQPAMQPQPVDAAMMLQVTLQAQQWNGVLSALSEAPYRLAAPLIQAIGQQLQQQTQGAVIQPSGNGLDLTPTPPRQQ